MGVGGVNELGATFAPLAIGKAMTPHATAHALSCLQHHHVSSGVRQISGATEPRQARADDDDIVVHGVVRSGRVCAWLFLWRKRVGVAQNSVPCSSRMAAGTRRGTPLQGT